MSMWEFFERPRKRKFPHSLAQRIRRHHVSQYDPHEERRLVNALLPHVVDKDPYRTVTRMEEISVALEDTVRPLADRSIACVPMHRLRTALQLRAMMRFRPDMLFDVLKRLFVGLGVTVDGIGDLRELMLRTASLGTIAAGRDAQWFFVFSIQAPRYILETLRSAQMLRRAAGRTSSSALTERCDAFSAELIADRRFGIKTCYFRSDLLAGTDVICAADAEVESTEDETLTVFGERILGLMQLLSSGGKRPRPSRQNGIVRGSDGADAVDMLSWGEDTVYWCGWHVRFDGHLYMERSTVPLEDVLSAYRQSDIYPLWRLLVLLRIHDLVIPAEAADALQSLDELEKDICSGAADGHLTERLDAVIMPRIEAIRKMREGCRTDGSRTFRRHDVVWHIRRLPKAYRPSPRAQALAKEFSVTLGEHETFVRSHERGTGDEPMPVREVKFDR